MRVDGFEVVIGLGENEYRSMIEQAFGSSGPVLKFPFVVLGIMKIMRATKAAVSEVKISFYLRHTEA